MPDGPDQTTASETARPENARPETARPENELHAYDLVIVGGSAGGLSVAVSSLRSGLASIRVVEPGNAVVFPELVGDNQLDVGYGETVESIDVIGSSGDLAVNTNRLSYRTKAVLVAERHPVDGWRPPMPVPDSDRIHLGVAPEVGDQDVLVVGYTDHAIELTATAIERGNRVVLAAGGMDPTKLSPAGDNMLRRLERERKVTVLYRSVPDQIGVVDGFPMAFFDDRRTPDLQFDQVTFATPRVTPVPLGAGVSKAAMATGKVFFLGEPTAESPPTSAPGWRIGTAIAEACFPDLELDEPASPVAKRLRHQGAIEELRDEHYNAVITHFEPTHSDLWVLRVKPDHGDTSYLPGQYASLGLGFWEDRLDDAVDPTLDNRWDKLIRRSYSISSRMFDDHGYLTDEGGLDELEFYIVLVKPTPENVPALTPRLALKRPGDRIYLGPKVAGRYTLASVQDPHCAVILLSTGTGEAPHNAMAVELLRKGHVGPLVSAVSVRQWQDLGYLDKHRQLEERYPNYHYLPLPTREPDVPKRYIQDLIRDDVFGKDLGITLDPASTHIFLCGNPAMIGLPEQGDDGVEHFPATTGVVELLTAQGFTLDRRRSPGSIHYEEYW